MIKSISGRYSEYEVFSDWIRCMAISIQNTVHVFHDKVWKDREQTYLDTMRKYTEEERAKLSEMMGMLVETLEDGPDDVLGKIYMEAGMGSKATGQVFTPFHLAELTARLSLEDSIQSIKDGMTKLTLNEPTCGGGAMIIATAKALQDAGVNYQDVMEVVAQDIDRKGVYMCYVQLSLLGISAICVQGDTIADPYVPGKTDPAHILETPKKMGALL